MLYDRIEFETPVLDLIHAIPPVQIFNKNNMEKSDEFKDLKKIKEYLEKRRRNSRFSSLV
ncbi:MAG: hypothetical protein PHV30_06720 [Candidatus Margulisbacteria bacterium]|nr:hypothetical protein [Candidatus Margulisiibacteriota bacterium]